MPKTTKKQTYTNLGGEMSYAEIAKVMGISHESVRKIEQSALTKLKRFENRFSLQDIRETLALLDRPRGYQLLNTN